MERRIERALNAEAERNAYYAEMNAIFRKAEQTQNEFNRTHELVLEANDSGIGEMNAKEELMKGTVLGWHTGYGVKAVYYDGTAFVFTYKGEEKSRARTYGGLEVTPHWYDLYRI